MALVIIDLNLLFSDSIASLSLDSKHIDTTFVKHDAKQQKEHSAISLNAWDWATANTSSCLNLETSLNLCEYDSHFQQERDLGNSCLQSLCIGSSEDSAVHQRVWEWRDKC